MVIEIESYEHFGQVVFENPDKVVLVEFYSPTCAPCKMLMAQLSQIEDERFVIAKVDGTVHKDIAGHFHVMTVPHVMIWKDGILKHDWIRDFKPKAKIVELLESLI